MPVLQTIRNIIEVKLPSFGDTDPAIVKMYDSILVSDYDSVDSEDRKDRAYGILAAIITEWNLVDENNNPIPINASAIRRLKMTDLSALNVALKDSTPMSEAKKNS